MDKYEFNIKVEQIKKLVGKSDYETAMKIADTIDWRRVRNTTLLSMVATVYEKNKDYDEAREIILLAFERAPNGKRLLYKLAELALKSGDIDEAEAYYREFSDMAPDDPRQQLLRYMILKAKGAPAQQLIHSLESYTSQELDEKWLYELAELYSLAGLPQQCIETCDKIMLMFGLGKYVDKAMELKVQYAPLSSYQVDLVENRDKYEAKLRAVEEEFSHGRRRPVEEETYQQAEPEIYEEEVDAEEEEVTEEISQEEEEAEETSYMPSELEAQQVSAPAPRFAQDPMGNTRVLDDIRRINRPVTVIQGGVSPIPRPHGVVAVEGRGQSEELDQTRVLAAPSAVPSEETEEEVSLQFEDLEEEEEEETPIPNHLMIEARTPEKGLQIAVDALKKIHKENGINNTVAKISGTALSKRGVLASAEKLAGKDLVVQNAGDMTQQALEELEQLMSADTTGMIVVLIDNPRQMEMLHRAHPDLAAKFECIGSGEETIPGDETDYSQQKEAILESAAASVSPLSYTESRQKETVYSDINNTRTLNRSSYREEEHMAENSALAERGSYGDQEEVYEEEQKPKKGFFWSKKKTAFEEELPEEAEEEYYQDEAEQEDYIPVHNQEGPGSHGEEMDIDEFAQYACKYASEIDCSITGKSMLALYERIEIMEEDGVPLTRNNAEDLIEEAADRAEKPSFGKRLKNIFSSKYDKDGLLILKEEHFIY